jgi:hypothetical protein
MSRCFSYKFKDVIPLPKEIRFNPDLSPGEKLFLAEIDSLCKKKPCPFSSRGLKEHFNVSHQTILNWVMRLVKMKLLVISFVYDNKNHGKYIKTQIVREKCVKILGRKKLRRVKSTNRSCPRQE